MKFSLPLLLVLLIRLYARSSCRYIAIDFVNCEIIAKEKIENMRKKSCFCVLFHRSGELGKNTENFQHYTMSINEMTKCMLMLTIDKQDKNDKNYTH